MSKFVKGFVFGLLTTVGVLAGAAFSFKKSVVDPIEDQEAKFEDNRRMALRKSRSAHNG